MKQLYSIFVILALLFIQAQSLATQPIQPVQTKESPTELCYFDFEAQSQSYKLDNKIASITTDPKEVLDGKASLKVETTSTNQERDNFLTTISKQTPLKAGKRYEVTFQYHVVDVNLPDSYFYMTARSRSWTGKANGEMLWRENFGTPSTQSKRFMLPADVDDYQIHFGVHKKGTLIIDNISIKQLPDMNVQADGVEVKSENYQPYGMCSHLSWPNGVAAYIDKQVLEAIRLMKEAGAQWFRTDLAWSDIEPKRGRFNTRRLDRIDMIVEEAIKNQMSTYILLFTTPRWASEKPDQGDYWAYAPKDMKEWANHVTFIARRYKGKVRHWEIGNEVDWFFWRSDMPKYAEYLKTAYKALKEVDPENKIIMSGLAFDGRHVWQFRKGAEENCLQKLYDNGVKDHFDILAVHPYSHTIENPTVKSADKINSVYDIMKKNGDSHKPMWITEIGTSSAKVDGTEHQAKNLETVFTELIKHPKIEKVFWYNFRCKNGQNNLEDNFGIVNNDLTPRPAYEKFKTIKKSKTRRINQDLLK